NGIIDQISVNGDPEKLHQMTLNLALNAIQSSPHGGSVNISLSRKGSDGVCLSVSDEGSGVEPKDIPRMFEPFFTTRASGTGLGLALVKTIVDSHEGDIAVNSETDRGTTVNVTLPLYRR
ncbi:MAG: hypothetical protein GY835_24745, partial [bacterium]|nr:hypothetical protein [bacterium]